jgi:uncharacterized protein YgiM (DUF1202 family)
MMTSKPATEKNPNNRNYRVVNNTSILSSPTFTGSDNRISGLGIDSVVNVVNHLENGKWAEIRSNKGEVGYVLSNDLSLVRDTPTKPTQHSNSNYKIDRKYRVVNNTNIYSSPRLTGSNIIATSLKIGATVNVVDLLDDVEWVRIQSLGGKTGYIQRADISRIVD